MRSLFLMLVNYSSHECMVAQALHQTTKLNKHMLERNCERKIFL
jgi:hypothetical protein